MKSTFTISILLLFIVQFLSRGLVQAQNFGTVTTFQEFLSSNENAQISGEVKSLAFDNIASLYFEGDKIVSSGDIHAKRFVCLLNAISPNPSILSFYQINVAN